MQILKEAGPLADCFTVPYREKRMALWLVIPKLVLQFVSQTGLLFPVHLLWKDDLIFLLERIRAFFIMTKHVLTQIFFSYKYICE